MPPPSTSIYHREPQFIPGEKMGRYGSGRVFVFVFVFVCFQIFLFPRNKHVVSRVFGKRTGN
jgi:hypothetical protein